MEEKQKVLIELGELRIKMLNEGSPKGAEICKNAMDYIGQIELLVSQSDSQPMQTPGYEDRKVILLKAAHTLLRKCERSSIVLDPMEQTVFYDDAECDGSCLMEDIALELDLEVED